MDNMVITGNLIKIINWIKGEFKKSFEISDLGKIKWLLGLKVDYIKNAWTISISQGAYVNKLIEYFGLENTNSIHVHPSQTWYDPILIPVSIHAT